MIQKTAFSTTQVEDINLIYLEDQGIAGIHIRGLAKLLNCNPKTIQRLATGVAFDHIFEAQIQTEGGLQSVTFILEEGVIQILEAIQDGRHKKETKLAARDLYRRFARAGFKLYVMLQTNPKANPELKPAQSTLPGPIHPGYITRFRTIPKELELVITDINAVISHLKYAERLVELACVQINYGSSHQALETLKHVHLKLDKINYLSNTGAEIQYLCDYINNLIQESRSIRAAQNALSIPESTLN